VRREVRWMDRAIRGVALLALAAGFALLAPERVARAHAVGVSSAQYVLDGSVLRGDFGLSNRELAGWLPALDTNGDGAISSEEMDAGSATAGAALLGGLVVTADGKPCKGALVRARVMEDEGSALFGFSYTCPQVPGHLTLSLPLLERLGPSHRNMARLFRDGKAQAKVLDRAHPTWTLDGGGSTSSSLGMAWSMLKLGIEHILTGADHLVFLFGLILVGGRLRSLIGVVSAFTLAHSITLALAALSIFAPSPRLVEPAIALSIAYVGVENLFVRDASKRWRITFPFGLIHGFGFAGALREIALPRAQVPVALVSFNLGVEIGQLAVLSVALPLVLTVRRAPWFGDRGVKVLSLAIAIGGAALFVVRLAAR
jgi:HupE / UreJ protein